MCKNNAVGIKSSNSLSKEFIEIVAFWVLRALAREPLFQLQRRSGV